jgi:hypothetical protein
MAGPHAQPGWVESRFEKELDASGEITHQDRETCWRYEFRIIIIACLQLKLNGGDCHARERL